MDLFFFKLQSAFLQFQTITISECCLIKLLPYILSEKYIYILGLEMVSQPREPALCQLYRHTFVPYGGVSTLAAAASDVAPAGLR